MAQKKQLQAVRDQIKSGKELTKAENTLRGLLVDSASKKNNKIWLLLCDALTKQYEQGNEKLYLNPLTALVTVVLLLVSFIIYKQIQASAYKRYRESKATAKSITSK